MLNIQRVFDIVRLEHKVFGLYTRFGFEAGGLIWRSVDIDGHPPLNPGKHIFCISKGSGMQNVLAYWQPAASEISTGGSIGGFVITLIFLSLAIGMSGTLLINAIANSNQGTSFAPILFAVSIAIFGLCWIALWHIRRLLAVRKIKKYIANNHII